MPTGPPEALRSTTGGMMIARFALLSGSALLALTASPASAQDSAAPPEAAPQPSTVAPPDPAQPPSATIQPAAADSGDIIITARRRNETLQEVPLAVSVIGDERLTSTGSFNVLRLSQIQP